jgi:hypothetical protein
MRKLFLATTAALFLSLTAAPLYAFKDEERPEGKFIGRVYAPYIQCSHGANAHCEVQDPTGTTLYMRASGANSEKIGTVLNGTPVKSRSPSRHLCRDFCYYDKVRHRS